VGEQPWNENEVSAGLRDAGAVQHLGYASSGLWRRPRYLAALLDIQLSFRNSVGLLHEAFRKLFRESCRRRQRPPQ
jgi:hypothetical protein